MADAKRNRRESLVDALDILNELQNAADQLKSPAKKKVRKRPPIKEQEMKPDISRPVFKEDDDLKPLPEAVEFVYSWPKCVCGMSHPPIPHFTKPDGKRCTYYWQIADEFPFLSLHRTLSTEIKFLQADKDQSGLIELSELRSLLKAVFDVSVITDKMIEKTFKAVDVDGSGAIDFFEVLSVMFSLIQRYPTNLPNVVQANFTKVCSIQ